MLLLSISTSSLKMTIVCEVNIVAWINVGTHHLVSRTVYHTTWFANTYIAEDSAPHTRTNTATSSFFLTPQNFFDSDVSIDSANSILLSNPEKPGLPFSYDEFGVEERNCAAPVPKKFEYTFPASYDLDGKPIQRNLAFHQEKIEMYHRVKAEL